MFVFCFATADYSESEQVFSSKAKSWEIISSELAIEFHINGMDWMAERICTFCILEENWYRYSIYNIIAASID